MLTNGRLYVDALLGPIDQAIKWIDNAPVSESLRMSLRAGFCALPAFVGSVLIPSIAPIFVFVSVALIYFLFNPVQEKLFDLEPKERHWFICIPVHAFYLLWACILLWTGNTNQISRTVGGVVIITAVALWPIYKSKKKYQAKERKISFTAAYFVFMPMVIIQQLFIISEELFR